MSGLNRGSTVAQYHIRNGTFNRAGFNKDAVARILGLDESEIIPDFSGFVMHKTISPSAKAVLDTRIREQFGDLSHMAHEIFVHSNGHIVLHVRTDGVDTDVVIFKGPNNETLLSYRTYEINADRTGYIFSRQIDITRLSINQIYGLLESQKDYFGGDIQNNLEELRRNGF